MMWQRVVGVIALGLIGTPLGAAPFADTVLLHGHIDAPNATALAISQGVIVGVGTDEQMTALIGPKTHQVDLQGHWVLAGFNDAHVHLLSGGLELSRVDLHGSRSIEDLKKRLRSQAQQVPPGQWIQGSGWDETLFTQKRWPNKADLDSVVADRPVVLERTDGHAAVVNSKALALLKITRTSVDPPGGLIERDAQGEPTGVLKDAAMNSLATTIPPLDAKGRESALMAGMKYAASLGVTTVQDMSTGYLDSDEATVLALRRLDARGQMPIRVSVAIALHSLKAPEAERAHRLLSMAVTPYVRVIGFKAFADGSAGSRTAYFQDGYTDRPAEHGLLGEDFQDADELHRWLSDAVSLHAQVCTHAIGDAAVDSALDAYERLGLPASDDRRFRIEHAQHLSPQLIKRMADLHVIASMQPFQGIDDGRWIGARVGAARLRYSYPWASLQKAGVRLAFGTDWPVVPLDPWAGVYAAVARIPLDGSHSDGWAEDEKISLRDAIDAYTVGSAIAEFTEMRKGRIAVGQWADVVEWQKDVFNRPVTELRDNQAIRTWVGGKLVYLKSSPRKTG